MPKNLIRFVHISDTHILKTYDKSMFAPMIESGLPNPSENLEITLKAIARKHKKLDFVLFTGDLVQEGEAIDYKYFKELVKSILQVPVFVALGNHDVKEAFYTGYLDESASVKPYYYSAEMSGYRIICLDTSDEHKTAGKLDDNQLDWLKKLLKTRSENGTVLIMHHPPVGELKRDMFSFGLDGAEELIAAIADSDVRAIFAGHVHTNSIQRLGDISVVTTSGTSFGVDIDEENVNYTKKAGYIYCEMTQSDLLSEFHEIPENVAAFSRALKL